MNCIKINQINTKINQDTLLNSDNLKYQNEMSTAPGNYQVKNIYNCNGINEINSFANLTNGFIAQDGYGINPRIINEESEIKYGNLTNKNNINQLFPRSIGTVPLLVKKMDLNADAFIKSPEYGDNSKSYKTVSDSDFNRFIPLIPCLENNVQNINHIIPENSLSYWKQGGISTRDLVKNTDYIKKLQNYKKLCNF